MEGFSENYLNIYSYYKLILKSSELDQFRLEIKEWLENEREGRNNQIAKDDLQKTIEQTLDLYERYLNLCELIEISSFKINTNQHLILQEEISFLLSNISIRSETKFNEYRNKIIYASIMIKKELDQTYVRRSINDVSNELVSINIEVTLNTHPRKLKNLLNECIYLDEKSSVSVSSILEARNQIIEIIRYTNWLNELKNSEIQEKTIELENRLNRTYDLNLSQEEHLLNHLKTNFCEKLNQISGELTNNNRINNTFSRFVKKLWGYKKQK